MPRELTLVTRRAPDADDLRDAARDVDAHAIIGSARNGALQLVLGADREVLLSVEYATFVGVADEIARLAPAAAAAVPGPAFWTEVWVPFGPFGEQAAAIAKQVAAGCEGVCVGEDGELL